MSTLLRSECLQCLAESQLRGLPQNVWGACLEKLLREVEQRCALGETHARLKRGLSSHRAEPLRLCGAALSYRRNIEKENKNF